MLFFDQMFDICAGSSLIRYGRTNGNGRIRKEEISESRPFDISLHKLLRAHVILNFVRPRHDLDNPPFLLACIGFMFDKVTIPIDDLLQPFRDSLTYSEFMIFGGIFHYLAT